MATIKDIAKLAKVSPSTVSRVLNLDTSLSVGDDTRNRIIAVAEKLSYKTRRQRVVNNYKNIKIGVIHRHTQKEETENPYYLSIARGIERACQGKKIMMVTIFKNEDKYILNDINDYDGVITMGKFGKEDIAEFSICSSNIVAVDYSPDDKLYDSIVIDCSKASLEALDYLYSIGHREIGFIGGHRWVGKNKAPMNDERERSYIKFMQGKGLYNPNHKYVGEFTTEDGYNLMKKAVADGNLPTAFFIASDSMAMGALQALYEANINVPQDVSIIGFNDIPSAKYMVPPLTTVKVYTEFMGSTAVELLLERIVNRRSMPKKIVIHTDIVIRESCRDISSKSEKE